MAIYCYTVSDDTAKFAETYWYGLTSTRDGAFGAGIRLARRMNLHNWTVKVDEVAK